LFYWVCFKWIGRSGRSVEESTFSTIETECTLSQWYAGLDTGSLTWTSLNFESPAQYLSSGSHSLQAGSTSVGGTGTQFTRTEALAVVNNGQAQDIVVQRQDDAHLPSLSMFACVEQRFLQDADECDPCFDWQIRDRFLSLEFEFSGRATSRQVGIYLSPDPLDEGSFKVGTRGLHVGNKLANLLGGMLSTLFQGGQFFNQRLQPSPLQQFAAETGLQDKLLGRLGHTIMQLTRHVRTLVFHHLEFAGHGSLLS
jgi:hypothetical protein